MPEIYLKTLFSSPYEINFIRMNVFESQNLVKKVLVYEYNTTHTGEAKPYYFEKLIPSLSSEELSKIEYRQIDSSSWTKIFRGDPLILRNNETKMRNYFFKENLVKNNDLIISVDADEVLYSNTYKKISDLYRVFGPSTHINLKLRQLMYRPNILWDRYSFWAPTCATGQSITNPEESNWRYTGRRLPLWAGCHFSWNIPISAMKLKISTYGHADKYAKYADEEVLRKAVDELKYVFEPTRNILLKRMSEKESLKILPASTFKFDWNHLK